MKYFSNVFCKFIEKDLHIIYMKTELENIKKLQMEIIIEMNKILANLSEINKNNIDIINCLTQLCATIDSNEIECCN